MRSVAGRITATDTFAADYIKPRKDKKQHVTLLAATAANGLLNATFTRPLVPCDADEEDLPIDIKRPARVMVGTGSIGLDALLPLLPCHPAEPTVVKLSCLQWAIGMGPVLAYHGRKNRCAKPDTQPPYNLKGGPAPASMLVAV